MQPSTDVTKDPVCGMMVDPKTALSIDLDHKCWYFCSEHCRSTFQARAAQGVIPLAPSAAGNGRATPVMMLYTCPMHPEVRQDHPGDCPICGMALEPRTPLASSGMDTGAADLHAMRWRLAIASVLTLPVLLLAMAHVIPAHVMPRWTDEVGSRWMQLAFSTPVVWWAGWSFFQRGFRSIISRQLNMFTLISVGVGAAYCYSLVALLLPTLVPHALEHGGTVPLYFESAAVVVVLVMLGQVLELSARCRTGDAVKALLDLSPPTARQVAPGGDHIVPLEQVRIGDWLRVVPGDRVPVDGVVVEGCSRIEESMITGEPDPVEKAIGDAVTAGTINGTGSFVMRAERIGSDTVLGRIVSMVSEAQRSRAPIQGLADRVAEVFVPIVLVIACLTGVLWMWIGPEPRLPHAIISAVAVLIIACPCALGLATPMSIMLGIGRGAQIGVLIKNAQALEQLAQVATIVIDKTGTLTEGRPVLIDVLTTAGVEAAEIIRLAAALEVHSEHPLALAIVAGAKARDIPVESSKTFSSTAGGGVTGTVHGRLVSVGTLALMSGQGVAGMKALEDPAATFQEQGKTVVFVAVDAVLTGILSVADPIKSTSAEAIQELHDLGLQVIMLTGDHRRTAAFVAKTLNLDGMEAEVQPAGKAAHIRKLRAQGIQVAMVGDGINDAPALSEADVGIAMGSGTEVAMESAGITLVRGDLLGLAMAVRLSRATMNNIRQNLFFAFLYNILGIPLAAGVLYPFFGIVLTPMIAGAAMSLSSVSVIWNALRLRRARLTR